MDTRVIFEMDLHALRTTAARILESMESATPDERREMRGICDLLKEETKRDRLAA
jgi:hypothetical protein